MKSSLFWLLNERIKMADSFVKTCAQLGCDIASSGWPDHFGRITHDAIVREDTEKEPIRVLSLFSGAGGLDIGFRDAGFQIIESVEVEKKFCASLTANSGEGGFFDHARVNCLDIREYHPQFSKIDFIIGGPPCQTFSAAGRRANGVLGTDDARGTLFQEYARLLNALKPKGFLFENVYGIIGAQGGKPWRDILEYFTLAGYKLFYRVLDAADYGVPQHRERLIIVGLQDGIYHFPRPLFGPDSADNTPFYTASTAIESAPSDGNGIPPVIGGRYGNLIPEIPPGLNYSYFTEKMGNPNAIFAWRSKFSDFMYKADPDTPVRTIKAQGGQYTGPFHWENRHFTVPEYKRLQTFPDNYIISGGRQTQIQQIGNSVPPQLARILALTVRSQVFNRSIPFRFEPLGEKDVLGFRKRKALLTKRYQAKANAALKKQMMPTISKTGSELFYASLDSSFDFVANSKRLNHHDYLINVVRDRELSVSAVAQDPGHESTSVSLQIVPTDTWTLPYSRINAKGSGDDCLLLTTIWKAIEYALSSISLKADLVQLSGYYQYPSQISCELTGNGLSLDPTILKLITNGMVTRKLLSEEELALKLGTKTADIDAIAKQLRRLGYEVRNHNTNSQIPHGYWLIPYEFPTLTPLSIQLRKQV